MHKCKSDIRKKIKAVKKKAVLPSTTRKRDSSTLLPLTSSSTSSKGQANVVPASKLSQVTSSPSTSKGYEEENSPFRQESLSILATTRVNNETEKEIDACNDYLESSKKQLKKFYSEKVRMLHIFLLLTN